MNETGVLRIPLPDAAARERIARDLETNLLVEAGAGSGKTTELVTRMRALLASGTARIEEIAAVTFTRKAAGELRERLQMRLEEDLRAARADAAADPSATERLGRALEQIDRAFVGTIHSFCARLLRERPLEVGLDPDFEEVPLEERTILRRRFWEAYLERLTRDSDPILEELSRAGIRPTRLSAAFERLVDNPDVEFPAEDSRPPSASEITSVRSELEAIVDHGWELMPEREPAPQWDSLQRKLRTLHFTRGVTGWKESADFFEALAALCKPAGPGHRIVQKRWREAGLAVALRDRVNAFAVGDTPARRVLERWYAHRYALAIRLARHAAADFASHRLRTGRLDFQDLLALAARLLRTDPLARRQLGERYRWLLVDEFQDTDPLQAEIVLLLSSEPSTASEGGEGGDTAAEVVAGQRPAGEADWREAVPRPGALFVVGDPKQSIYRFRRADIQLYGFVKERFAAFGDVVELTANFRSRPPIGDLVNEVFDGPGFFPEQATAEQAPFEALNTRPPVDPVVEEGVFVYDIEPEAANRAAAAADDAARIGTWIRGRVDAGERKPGDFLILTRRRGQIAAYARALEERSVPVQVTGAGVGAEDEILELEILLECMIDPGNPVRVLAVLVGLFFGVDYEQLVAHRLSGGRLDVVRPGDQGDERVLEALRALHGWWKWSIAEPADVFVSRLVDELGLLPYAAAGDLGVLRAGALVYGLDAVRAAALGGDASLPGALSALRAALELTEAEAPLEPGRPDVVRLMNLHQAKGLEADVVILADPSHSKDRPPEVHTERRADGRAAGWIKVAEPRGGFGGDRLLAVPEGWEAKEEEELRFERAEEVRLLYVAVTRAREELVVARWTGGTKDSPWAPLEPWLEKRATRLELEARAPEGRERLDLGSAAAAGAAEQAARTLSAMAAPRFEHTSVTALAKDRDEGGSGDAAPRGGGTGVELRGLTWGSAVHGALAAAARAGTSEEGLRATCRDLLVEQGRPLDDHGEPVELVELLELVRAVRASELWARADAAERRLVEVPFAAPDVAGFEELPAPTEPSRAEARGKERRQLDLFAEPPAGSAARGEEQPEQVGPGDAARVLEGVIDLAFREPDGWVIADYKTDVGTDPDFAARATSYRRQVELYARAWSDLTGEHVKERVLFYTAQGRIELW